MSLLPLTHLLKQKFLIVAQTYEVYKTINQVKGAYCESTKTSLNVTIVRKEEKTRLLDASAAQPLPDSLAHSLKHVL